MRLCRSTDKLLELSSPRQTKPRDAVFPCSAKVLNHWRHSENGAAGLASRQPTPCQHSSSNFLAPSAHLRRPLPLRLVLSATSESQEPTRLIGRIIFHSRDPVMATGVYRVIHSQHRLPPEVSLIQGHTFPGCSKCRVSVRFEFLRSIKPRSDFQINLFNLPELPDSDEGKSEKSQAA